MRIGGHEIIYKCVVGSNSYGTNVEGSDIDYKGVYIQTPKSVLYEGYVPQIEIGKDEVYYEVGRFLELCEKANPTTLELLYSPQDCIVHKHPVFDTILENRQMFLTKRCRQSFGGYAVHQLENARSLDKKMNWEKERYTRKNILDFCYIHRGTGSIKLYDFLIENHISQRDIGLSRIPHMKNCFAAYYDYMGIDDDFYPFGIAIDIAYANDVSTTAITKKIEEHYVPYLLYFNKDEWSKHCTEYLEYQKWLSNRNEQRYVDVKNHGQKIDGKNLLHCIRLLDVANEIPVQKVINVRRPNADYLISVRKGEYNLEQLMWECEANIEALNALYDNSDLPDSVDSKKAKWLGIQVREIFEKVGEHKQYY